MRTVSSWRLIGRALCLSLVLAAPLRAQQALEATSAEWARQDAIAAVPWAKLAARESQVVRQVVDKACIYRRLPTKVIECDTELFTLLVERPELIVSSWRVLGLSKLKLTQQADGSYLADDGNGTRGRIRVLEKVLDEKTAQNRVVVLAEGTYEGPPFLTAVPAKCLVVLRSGSTVETNGRRYVTARIDSFLHVERVTVDLLARSLRPLVASTADHNFIETMRYISSLNKTAERSPASIAKLARHLRDVDPAVRERFRNVAIELAVRDRQRRDGQQTAATPPSQTVLRPVIATQPVDNGQQLPLRQPMSVSGHSPDR